MQLKTGCASIEIVTPRLHLRRLNLTDAELFFRGRSDPAVSEYQFWRPQSITEINEFLAKQEQLTFNTPDTWLQMGICLKNSDQLIGDCGLHFVDEQQMEIGYTIYPDYQGNGYASEAVQFLLQQVFIQWGKHRVWASADPRNAASVRVLERSGFRKEAHFIKSVCIEGEWCDDVVYGMLAEEWALRSRQRAASSTLRSE